MGVRLFPSLAAVAAVAWFAAPPVAAQTAAPKTPAAPARPGAPRSAKAWTPPRTAWGDPDLSGSYTNTNESGTPFERGEAARGHRRRSAAIVTVWARSTGRKT